MVQETWWITEDLDGYAGSGPGIKFKAFKVKLTFTYFSKPTPTAIACT